MKILLILIASYFLGMNIFGFILMGVDKKRAERDAWRVSEFTLFLVAILGGSIGSILGMYIFRHKTKHPLFFIGMPVILILQISVAVWIIFLAPYSIRFM